MKVDKQQHTLTNMGLIPNSPGSSRSSVEMVVDMCARTCTANIRIFVAAGDHYIEYGLVGFMECFGLAAAPPAFQASYVIKASTGIPVNFLRCCLRWSQLESIVCRVCHASIGM